MAHRAIDPRKYFAAYLDSAIAPTIAGEKATGEAIQSGAIMQTIMALPTQKQRDAAAQSVDRAAKRRKEFITDILNRYENERNSGMDGMRGTAWAAYNAVSEQIDHSTLFRANKDAEGRFERVLLGAGDDLKQEAFGRALAMAQ